MRIVQATAAGPSSLAEDFGNPVLAIGNFDGVHIGHQSLIATAGSAAQWGGRPLGVLTFEPHPRQYFNTSEPAFRLTPAPIKRRLLEALNVELLIELRFDADLAAMAAEDFVDFLVTHFAPSHVVIGWDFCFGRDRKGNAALLRALAPQRGFALDVVDPVRDVEQDIYSSNLIRDHLRDGQPERAAALLGHLWEIEGEVLRGEQLGRTLGFPTANIAMDDYLLPQVGIYAGRAGEDAGRDTIWRDCVVYIGRRPTIDGGPILLEFHLFDFVGEIYGQHWRVALVDFLRPDEKFDGLDALKAQIAKDARQARQVLAARRIRAGSLHFDVDGPATD